MWPIIMALGQRFSGYLVLPAAALIGTIGYFAERHFAPRPKPIPYLETTVQEERERRLAEGEASSEQRAKYGNTLHLNEPAPSDR